MNAARSFWAALVINRIVNRKLWALSLRQIHHIQGPGIGWIPGPWAPGLNPRRRRSRHHHQEHCQHCCPLPRPIFGACCCQALALWLKIIIAVIIHSQLHCHTNTIALGSKGYGESRGSKVGESGVIEKEPQ